MAQIGQAWTEEVAGAAADWHVRLNSGDATEDDWRAFTLWLEAAPEHQAAFDRLDRLTIELENLSLAATPLAEVVPLTPRAPRRSWPWAIAGLAAAAACALVVVTAWRTTQTGASQGPSPVAFETVRGERRRVALADGTQVDLSPGTRIEVLLGGRERTVAMSGGEAIFDVAKDAGRPFRITVGDRRVEVVGTEFDIRRVPGRTLVTVRRGIVAVSPSAGGDLVRLTAGRQLAHDDGAPVSTVREVDPDASFAWRSGRLIYDDRPLSEVVADLNRYFEGGVRLADPELAGLRFSGVLVVDAEEAVVRRLEGLVPVRAERTASGWVLSAAR